MSGPDYRRGYLRVPLPVWLAVYCQARLTRRQLQMVSVVIRESWGWQRDRQPYLWTRPLPPSRFAELTGLSTDRLARDLRDLVRRGVLREWDRCYQFVPEPADWLCAPPDRRRRGAIPAAPAADPALLPGGVNITDIQERNVTPVPDAVPGHTAHPPGSVEGAPSRADRFVRILLGFVGPLPPSRWAEVRRWVERAGVAEVWRQLEPGFRRGPASARLHLAAALQGERRRASPDGTPDA